MLSCSKGFVTGKPNCPTFKVFTDNDDSTFFQTFSGITCCFVTLDRMPFLFVISRKLNHETQQVFLVMSQLSVVEHCLLSFEFVDKQHLGVDFLKHTVANIFDLVRALLIVNIGDLNPIRHFSDAFSN